MPGRFEVVVGAGVLRSADPSGVRWPHRWNSDGVTVPGDLTGVRRVR